MLRIEYPGQCTTHESRKSSFHKSAHQSQPRNEGIYGLTPLLDVCVNSYDRPSDPLLCNRCADVRIFVELQMFKDFLRGTAISRNGETDLWALIEHQMLKNISGRSWVTGDGETDC